jgi:uncharacterized protein YjbI with pentapeptide repeats
MKTKSLCLLLVLTGTILLAQSPTQSPVWRAELASGLETNLSGTRFHRVSLMKAHFAQSDLSKTTFQSVNFSGVAITSSDLTGAEISSCNLSGMKIDGVLVTDLQRAYAEAKKK